MDAKKCDRCGNFYTETEPNALQSLLTGLLEYHPMIAKQMLIEGVIDLCPECSRDLTKWLNMKGEK